MYNPLSPVFTLLSHSNSIFISGTLKYRQETKGIKRTIIFN